MGRCKRDYIATDKAIKEKFIRRGDFIGTDGHEYLSKSHKKAQRARVFELNRVMHNGVNRCHVCLTPVTEFGADGFHGEWHHTRKCDCIECAEVRCGQLLRDCHRHRREGFKQVAARSPQFSKRPKFTESQTEETDGNESA